MSTSEIESELTSSELRSKLFQSFKSKGLVQSVKTQLRNRLALELHKNVANKPNEQAKKPFEDGSLFLQVSNSLIVDHMKCCSYDYSLSVFLSESLTDPEKVIPVKDVLQLLHIHPDSKLYQQMITEANNNFRGFLWTFLLQLAESHAKATNETSVQTDDDGLGKFGSLDEKLLAVERSQLHKLQVELHEDNDSLQTKVLSFQRKYETQKQAELKAEMERFRSLELSNMRLEERENCQKEISQIKTEYDKNYNKRLKELDKYEEESIGKSSRQKKMLDTEAFEQRQKMLAEMQSLKQREIELKNTHELAMKTLEIQEEKLKTRAEHLQHREYSIKQIEERYENRFKDEIIKMKYTLQEEGKAFTEEMKTQEQLLREDKISFECQKSLYMKWKDDAEKSKQEVQQLSMQLLTAKQVNNNLKENYEQLNRNYRKVSDYDQVKNENNLLQRDVDLLEKNLDDMKFEKAQKEKEHQKLVKELLNKISKKSPEVETNIQKDIEKTKIKERNIRENYQILHSKYELEVKKNEELQNLYEDLLLSQRGLLREIDELRTALMIANQEKEKLNRNQKFSSSDVNDLPKYSTKESVKRKLLSHNDATHLSQSLQRRELINDKGHLYKPLDASTDMLKKLEQEALELEKSYKKFQKRQENYNPRVHFNSFVQQRTNSTNVQTNNIGQHGTFNISNLIPDGTTSSFQPLPSVKLVSLQSSVFPTGLYSSTETSQPLSSTQAPGGSNAPSLGLSGVNTQKGSTRLGGMFSIPYGSNEQLVTHSMHPRLSTSDIQANYRSSITTSPLHPVEYQRQNVYSDVKTPNTVSNTYAGTFATCYSLTQHPLPETTIIVDSLTQYPLYDTRNYKTLTQFPLTESDIGSPKELAQATPLTKKLDTLMEQSTGHEQEIMDKNNDTNTESDVKDAKEPNLRTDSVEQEFHLAEASIATFESPTKPERNKELIERNNDVLYAPSTSVHTFKTEDNFNSTTSNNKSVPKTFSPVRSEDGNLQSVSSVLSQESDLQHSHVTLKHNSEASVNHEAISSVKDSGELDAKDLLSNNSLSEGELEPEKPVNDVMAKYMEMVLQKRENEEKDASETSDIKNQNSNNDIALSTDNDNSPSTDKSSEFEW